MRKDKFIPGSTRRFKPPVVQTLPPVLDRVKQLESAIESETDDGRLERLEQELLELEQSYHDDEAGEQSN